MIKKTIITILFFFLLIGTCFAYTSQELQNYVGQVCIVRLLDITPTGNYYIPLRVKLLKIYTRSTGEEFVTVERNNELFDLPIKMIIEIWQDNTIER